MAGFRRWPSAYISPQTQRYLMPISFDIFTFAPFVVLWVVLCTSIHNVCANQHTNTLKSPSSGSKILIHFIVWVRLTCFTGILCSHKAKRNNCENKYPQKGRRSRHFYEQTLWWEAPGGAKCWKHYTPADRSSLQQLSCARLAHLQSPM